MRTILRGVAAAALILSVTSAFAEKTEEQGGDTTVEHKKTMFGTKKTIVKSKSKSKAADGSEVDHKYEDTTKVHKNGKVEREATEKVEVTPPSTK